MSSSGPLTGITVLDLSTVGPGTRATRLLARAHVVLYPGSFDPVDREGRVNVPACVARVPHPLEAILVDVERDEVDGRTLGFRPASTEDLAVITQIEEDGFFFQGAESGHAFWGEEFYRLAKGVPGPVGKDGLEADLFAGLD